MSKRKENPDKEKIPAILERIKAGEGTVKACKAEGVKRPTFLLWVSQDAQLADNYARAREMGWDKVAEDIIDISDDTLGDPQRDRLRVDARKWLLSKMLPKKYGDKLDVTSDGEKMPVVTVNLAPHGGPVTPSE